MRRPGGITAWVPDNPKEEAPSSDNQPQGHGVTGFQRNASSRTLRTRHASLDMDNDIEVVIWDPKARNSLRYCCFYFICFYNVHFIVVGIF